MTAEATVADRRPAPGPGVRLRVRVGTVELPSQPRRRPGGLLVRRRPLAGPQP
jgi:hypothetical protein